MNSYAKEKIMKRIIFSECVKNSKKALEKYDTNRKKYRINIINNIIYDEPYHLVAKFKEYLLWDETSDFLRRYYKYYESSTRIEKIHEFYTKFSLLYSNYYCLDEKKFLDKNIKRKKKLLDIQNDINDDDEADKTRKKYSTIIKNSILRKIDEYSLCFSNNTSFAKNDQKLNQKIVDKDISAISYEEEKNSFISVFNQMKLNKNINNHEQKHTKKIENIPFVGKESSNKKLFILKETKNQVVRNLFNKNEEENFTRKTFENVKTPQLKGQTQLKFENKQSPSNGLKTTREKMINPTTFLRKNGDFAGFNSTKNSDSKTKKQHIFQNEITKPTCELKKKAVITSSSLKKSSTENGKFDLKNKHYNINVNVNLNLNLLLNSYKTEAKSKDSSRNNIQKIQDITNNHRLVQKKIGEKYKFLNQFENSGKCDTLEDKKALTDRSNKENPLKELHLKSTMQSNSKGKEPQVNFPVFTKKPSLVIYSNMRSNNASGLKKSESTTPKIINNYVSSSNQNEYNISNNSLTKLGLKDNSKIKEDIGSRVREANMKSKVQGIKINNFEKIFETKRSQQPNSTSRITNEHNKDIHTKNYYIKNKF